MYQKTIARKDSSFLNLTQYITKEAIKDYVFTHNMKSQKALDPLVIAREFYKHSKLIKARKNGNIFYHDILSLHPDDTKHIKNPDVLHDLFQKYISLRASKAKAWARIHYDKGKHIHIHIIISANELNQSTKVRMSKARFEIIKRKLERYQLEKYPNLKNSLVFQKKLKESKKRSQTIENRNKASKEKPSREDEIQEILSSVLSSPLISSLDDFKQELSQNGLEFYQRGKKSVGVIDKKVPMESGKFRKYKFDTLGLLDSFNRNLNFWKKRPRILKELAIDRKKSQVMETNLNKGFVKTLKPDYQ